MTYKPMPMTHKPMPTYREGLIIIPVWALTEAQMECAEKDIWPRVGDTLTCIQWDSSELRFSFSNTRANTARHFIARPWSLFKWSILIGWYDLKRFVRGQEKRPIETVADFIGQQKESR